MTRSGEYGRIEPLLRPVELFVLNDDPVYDTDATEWKVTAIPVRSIWGLASSGTWVGGGHRGELRVKRRWRQESGGETTLWMPDWWRISGSQSALNDPPNLFSGERVYAAEVDGNRCVMGDYKGKSYLGKLDSALVYNDATGVTVSIWTEKPASDTTRDLKLVIVSELLLTTGSLASGDGVRVKRIDNRWVVVGAACV